MYFLDEMAQHFLRNFKIRDNPVLHRTNRNDITWGPANHILGLITHGTGLARLGIYRHHGGLTQNDTLALDIHQRIGRTKVYGHVVGKQAWDFTQKSEQFIPSRNETWIVPTPQGSPTGGREALKQ